MGCHQGDSGHVTQVQVFRRVHPGTCGPVTLGEGSERSGHPGDCGCVTPGAGFADVGHPADCGHVTPVAGPEKRVTMETADV